MSTSSPEPSRHPHRALKICSVLLTALSLGCGTVSKLQVRGTSPARTYQLSALEKGGKCEADGNRLACELWDTSIEHIQPSPEERSRAPYPPVSLGIIEFNDAGKVNSGQREQVFQQIERTLKKHDGGIIVVFAHGWHHGPQTCDENLACLRRVLLTLARVEKPADQFKGGKVPIIGVYLGWRGEQYTKQPGSLLSIWRRKQVAQRIGREDALETLLLLDQIYNRNKDSRSPDRVRMVTIGHSLGGALVFTAVQNKLLTEVEVGSTHRIRPVAGGRPNILGDLVVLINPAIEATDYRWFHRAMRIGAEQDKKKEKEPILFSERPVLLTVASSADSAVGVVFPISRYIQLLWRPSRLLRGSSNFRGVGRFKPHITHDLTWKGRAEVHEVETPKCGCPYETGDYEMYLQLNLADQFDLKQRKEAAWYPGAPFITVLTDDQVIPSHNDIYNPRFVSFLMKLLADEPITSEESDAAPVHSESSIGQ